MNRQKIEDSIIEISASEVNRVFSLIVNEEDEVLSKRYDIDGGEIRRRLVDNSTDFSDDEYETVIRNIYESKGWQGIYNKESTHFIPLKVVLDDEDKIKNILVFSEKSEETFFEKFCITDENFVEILGFLTWEPHWESEDCSNDPKIAAEILYFRMKVEEFVSNKEKVKKANKEKSIFSLFKWVFSRKNNVILRVILEAVSIFNSLLNEEEDLDLIYEESPSNREYRVKEFFNCEKWFDITEEISISDEYPIIYSDGDEDCFNIFRTNNIQISLIFSKIGLYSFSSLGRRVYIDTEYLTATALAAAVERYLDSE